MYKAILGGGLIALSTSCGVSDSSLQGHYYWGAEVESFQPCGSGQSYWVVGEESLLEPLREKARAASAASGKPYQPVYVEVVASVEGQATEGFAAEYDGVYRFKKVSLPTESSPRACNPHR